MVKSSGWNSAYKKLPYPTEDGIKFLLKLCDKQRSIRVLCTPRDLEQFVVDVRTGKNCIAVVVGNLVNPTLGQRFFTLAARPLDGHNRLFVYDIFGSVTPGFLVQLFGEIDIVVSQNRFDRSEISYAYALRDALLEASRVSSADTEMPCAIQSFKVNERYSSKDAFIFAQMLLKSLVCGVKDNEDRLAERESAYLPVISLLCLNRCARLPVELPVELIEMIVGNLGSRRLFSDERAFFSFFANRGSLLPELSATLSPG